jgi:hypothetical protein
MFRVSVVLPITLGENVRAVTTPRTRQSRLLFDVYVIEYARWYSRQMAPARLHRSVSVYNGGNWQTTWTREVWTRHMTYLDWEYSNLYARAKKNRPSSVARRNWRGQATLGQTSHAATEGCLSSAWLINWMWTLFTTDASFVPLMCDVHCS